ncbi:MAG TPA: A24 family peptidase [Thermoanaerobaculia bacterium]|nr:A24 family peptidase [Thermoanaerobaculia bacterium]
MTRALIANASTVVTVLVCACAAWIDWRTRRIPDVLTLPAIGAGLFVVATQGIRLLAIRVAVVVLILAVAVALHALGVWGGGDGKLVAAIAAWKGLAFVANALVFSFFLGGVVAAFLLIRRRRRSFEGPSTIVFGPLIAAGTTIAAITESLRISFFSWR